MDKMEDIPEIIEALKQFRDDRDWEKFHNAKDLALAISIEASELNEVFLWKTPEEAQVDKIKEELADILSFSFLLAEKYQLNIKQIIYDKLVKNNLKYPVSKSKGSSKKYTEL
jgi:NTP pyrophosphatase (non-canonical NTP hydrolase)